MMNRQLTNLIMLFVVSFYISGCGVKGDPLPPETAPRLGRGHPTYTKASRHVTPDYNSQKEIDKEDQDDEEKK